MYAARNIQDTRPQTFLPLAKDRDDTTSRKQPLFTVKPHLPGCGSLPQRLHLPESKAASSQGAWVHLTGACREVEFPTQNYHEGIPFFSNSFPPQVVFED